MVHQAGRGLRRELGRALAASGPDRLDHPPVQPHPLGAGRPLARAGRRAQRGRPVAGGTLPHRPPIPLLRLRRRPATALVAAGPLDRPGGPGPGPDGGVGPEAGRAGRRGDGGSGLHCVLERRRLGRLGGAPRLGAEPDPDPDPAPGGDHAPVRPGRSCRPPPLHTPDAARARYRCDAKPEGPWRRASWPKACTLWTASCGTPWRT